MHRQFALAASVAALCLTPSFAFSAPEVVVSIKPVHSLVASVMKGVGEPALIVEGAASPHTYSLKPSNARALENADLVFWVGPGLEAFLAKPLESLPSNARVVELEDVQGLTKLAFREGGPFEAHDDGEGDDHDGHEHAADGAEKHDHGHEHEHEHAEAQAHGHSNESADHSHAGHSHDHAKEEHKHGDGHDDGHAGHDHAHGGTDLHLWLDPVNAKYLAGAIASELIEVDPDNREKYQANLKALDAEIDALDVEIREILAPVKDKRFMVFHDAYQYFEAHYGLRVAGSITVSPETMPGAERLSQIKAKISELGVACVFAEPQFDPRLIEVVTADTNAKTGTLDPEGAMLEPGAALYGDLMRQLAKSAADCMG